MYCSNKINIVLPDENKDKAHGIRTVEVDPKRLMEVNSHEDNDNLLVLKIDNKETIVWTRQLMQAIENIRNCRKNKPM